jgi:hypothetical protein
MKLLNQNKMKKITSVILLSLCFVSCKKETKETTPAPTGSCYCGEILQMEPTNTSIAVKNNCSGNILYFDIATSQWITLAPGDKYCRPQAW